MNAKNPNVQKIKRNEDVDRWTDKSNEYEKIDPKEHEQPNSVFYYNKKFAKKMNRSK